MTPPGLMTYVQAAAAVGLSQWALRRAAARRTPAAKRLRTVAPHGEDPDGGFAGVAGAVREFFSLSILWLWAN